jgi:hypothetical protein
MIRIWKEVLLPGRQQDRNGRWFTYTTKNIQQAHTNLRKMIDRGWNVPCIWEHQNIEVNSPEEWKAEWKANYAKKTFAHLSDSRINARGALEALHDLIDPADAKQLLKTRFVSPKVYPSYSDSRGGRYAGTTIAHVAATPTPVQFWQKPFELSRKDALYLSYAGDAMAEESDKKEEKVEKKDEKETPKKKDDGEPSPDEGNEFSKLVEALTEKGFNIPEEVDDLCKLIIAVKASSTKNDAMGDELDEGLNSNNGAPNTEGAGGPPMLMSATDPKVLAWAPNDRRVLDQRAVSLFNTGRIDRPTCHRLRREVRAVEMSYTAKGDLVQGEIHGELKAFEKLAKGTVWSATGKRGVDSNELSHVDPDADFRKIAGEGSEHETGQTETVKRQEELAARYSVTKK